MNNNNLVAFGLLGALAFLFITNTNQQPSQGNSYSAHGFVAPDCGCAKPDMTAEGPYYEYPRRYS